MLHRALIVAISSLCALSGTAFVSHTALAAPAMGAVAESNKDDDETLSLTEVKAVASAHFDKLDKDSNGTLDSGEVQGVIGKKEFRAADLDHDGTLSKDEFLALVEKVFRKADVDNDGTLTVKELGSPASRALKPLLE
jgi:Ca2+-binding EF-hand superfamily protein